MSGFERAETGDAWTTETVGPFPDDFSSEEAEFASELRTLFTPEHEELPPLFVETLLSHERHPAAELGFEHKLAYRVLRSLHLPRAPLYVHRTLWRAGARDALRHLSRPTAVAAATMLLIMALTMALVSPSFASGLSIILGHTGARQVSGYPSNVRTSTHPSGPSAAATHQQVALTFVPSWLGQRADNYVYASTRLDYSEELSIGGWSNGPIVDIQYVVPGHSTGTGLLDIREFQVASAYSAVLQVVQEGYASLVKVGETPAVYVDGAWSPLPGHEMRDAGDPPTPVVWQPGLRSELIMERGGVVFWIVGDLNDGAGQVELAHLASLLIPASDRFLHPHHIGVSVSEANASLDAAFRMPPGKEVYYEVPRGVPVDSGVGAFVAPLNS